MLNCDAIEMQPRMVNWVEEIGEDLDGYTSYEEIECPECNHTYVTPMFYGCCPECETEYDDLGPQMNYFYEVVIRDCEEAARKIAHLPLCVIELKDGTTGLALTGGGMNLSWEICDAFISLGYHPPLCYCHLPRMARWEHDERSQRILEACLESAKIAVRWAEGKAGECREMLAKIQAVKANEKAD